MYSDRTLFIAAAIAALVVSFGIASAHIFIAAAIEAAWVQYGQ